MTIPMTVLNRVGSHAHESLYLSVRLHRYAPAAVPRNCGRGKPVRGWLLEWFRFDAIGRRSKSIADIYLRSRDQPNTFRICYDYSDPNSGGDI